MKTLKIRRRKKNDLLNIPTDSELDKENLISEDDSENEQEELIEDSQSKKILGRDRPEQKPQKPMNCIVKLCFSRRVEPHLLFCEHHWKCIPREIRNSIKLHYDPFAERQSDEFFHIARKALEFAKRKIIQPPFSN